MPPNTTPGTATVVASLPFSVTQNAAGGADSAYVPSCNSRAIHAPLWFKYTPPAGVTAIGIHFATTNPAGSYFPNLSIWVGTPPSLAQLLTGGGSIDSCYYLHNPEAASYVSINVTPGTDYYFQVSSDSVTIDGDLLFELPAVPARLAPIGSFLVPNDEPGYPAVLLDATTGAVLQVFAFPSCEMGAWLPDGTLGVLAEQAANSNAVGAFNIYDAQLNLLHAVTSWISGGPYDAVGPVTCNPATRKFYVAGMSVGTPATFTRIYRIAADGTVERSWNIHCAVGSSPGSNGVQGIAVTADDSTLYFLRPNVNSGGFTQYISIGAWDLVNDVALADVIPNTANSWIQLGRDLVRTADGSLLFWAHTNAGANVYRYDTSGTLLHSYALVDSNTPRLCLDPSDATVFWVMHWPSGSSTGQPIHFDKIRISDGVVLATIVSTIVEPNISNPGPQFGASQSCPLLLNYVAITGGSTGEGAGGGGGAGGGSAHHDHSGSEPATCQSAPTVFPCVGTLGALPCVAGLDAGPCVTQNAGLLGLLGGNG